MKPFSDRAREGRVNPKGVPCLYVATTKETAMSEVRPWIGSYVSVAQFRAVRDINIIDCSVAHASQPLFIDEPDTPKILKSNWAHINRAFSEPATSADDTAEYAPTQILAELLDVTTRWPDDEEFEKGWLEKMVYVKSRPDRAVMLLRAIDAQMLTNKTEPIVLPEGLTVEHLLPQKGSISDYPYPEVADDEAAEAADVRRSRIIHTMGNLTLLTGPLNSSVSNGPFADKRPAIAENSALRLNARFQAPEKSSWSELDIAARGRDLFAYAKSLWPWPPIKVSAITVIQAGR